MRFKAVFPEYISEQYRTEPIRLQVAQAAHVNSITQVRLVAGERAHDNLQYMCILIVMYNVLHSVCTSINVCGTIHTKSVSDNARVVVNRVKFRDALSLTTPPFSLKGPS